MEVIAEMCPNIQVNVIDLNEERFSYWNDNCLLKLTVYKPRLIELSFWFWKRPIKRKIDLLNNR